MTRARSAGVVLVLVAVTSAVARLVALVAFLSVAIAAPARASDVSLAELQTLAAEAAEDPSALAELRRVDSVDGAPVDIEAALSGARGADLEARLDQLAEPYTVSSAARDPAAEARSVLAEDRFQQDRVPGPFRRILDWIGDRLPNPSVDWLDDLLPGGRSVVWIVLATVLAVFAAVVSRLFLTRRVSAGITATRLQAAARDEDPRSLDRRAEVAEAAGDLEAALRLRFRAGLLRLDEHGTIVFRPSISTYEVRRTLGSEDFDALAAAFDDIVYGGRDAEPADIAAARDRWPRILGDDLEGLTL